MFDSFYFKKATALGTYTLTGFDLTASSFSFLGST
jgi:hypothetical protein